MPQIVKSVMPSFVKLSESRKDNCADPYTVVFPWKSESILVNVVIKSLPQRGYLNWLVVAKVFSYSYLKHVLLYRLSFLRKACKLYFPYWLYYLLDLMAINLNLAEITCISFTAMYHLYVITKNDIYLYMLINC
jgi:hypothetical protein